MDTDHDLPLTGAAADDEIERLANSLDVPNEPLHALEHRGKRVKATGTVAAALVLVAAGLTAVNIAGIGPFHRGLPAATSAERHHQMRLDLLVTVGYVEDYQERTGALPTALADLDGEPPETVTFTQLEPGRYVVSVGVEPYRLEYDSAIAKELFFADEMGRR